MSSCRVRFAPSPTGMMHIGNARTALFNWLYARNQGGTFILRVEDTDVVRHVEESLRVIIEGFRWLGLDWDEGPETGGPCGPYYQSQRVHLYESHAQQLLDLELAYICECRPDSQEDCPCALTGDRELRPGVAVRLRNPGGTTILEDLVKGRMEFEDEVFGDFVLLKSDGMPTYNFANVVDDHLMRISHVIRGDDHVSNTPRQIMLYRAFGYDLPQFAHLPQILGDDGKRLSKRHGAVALTEYREQGFLPQGMMNYLALLGWSPKTEEEVMTPDELIARFRLEDVRRSPAMFSFDKLVWVNAHHMEDLDTEAKVALVRDILEREELLSPQVSHEDLAEIVEALGARLKYGAQVLEYGDYFFLEEFAIGEELEFRFQVEGVLEALSFLADRLEKLEPWTDKAIEETVRSTAKDRELKAGALIHAVRAALSGKAKGPSLFSLVRLVGRERTVTRLRRAVESRKD